MEIEDKRYFRDCMDLLAENCGTAITPKRMAFLWQGLNEYSKAQIDKACMRIARSRKFSSFPTMADFVDAIEGGQADIEDIATVEAGKVIEAISSVGPYRSVVFDDPITQSAIIAMGGWISICSELQTDDLGVFRGQFRRAYVSCSRTKNARYGSLRGLHDGYEGGEPRMIGCPEKAQKVLEAGGKDESRRLAPAAAQIVAQIGRKNNE